MVAIIGLALLEIAERNRAVTTMEVFRQFNISAPLARPLVEELGNYCINFDTECKSLEIKSL